VLSQPLEKNVAAERDADGGDLGVRLARRDRTQEEVEVLRLARVVEARAPVGQHPGEPSRIAGARPEVQRRAAISPASGQAQESLGVNGKGAALEAVEDDEDRRSRRARDPVHEELVPVRRLEALALEGKEPAAPREAAAERLRVGTRKPPGGPEHAPAGVDFALRPGRRVRPASGAASNQAPGLKSFRRRYE
jgi:hypothetical protein